MNCVCRFHFLNGVSMPNSEYEVALTYGKSAFRLLEKSQIPPTPQFYELLYAYASGTYPALSARINEQLGNGQMPSVDLIEELHGEFLAAHDANERISSVSEAMSAKIEAMHSAIDSAMATADSYSGSLRSASGDLGDQIDAGTLKSLAERLLSETEQMQLTNQALEEKLTESNDDIAVLQRDLDDVRRESMLDPLTQIFNRKYFDTGLAREMELANENGHPLSLLMIDIDHFKIFNDSFGHQTGDQVLRLVAMTLKSNIKGRDIPARYGGEEFTAVLPTTDLSGATVVAESIRKAIQAKELLKRSTNQKLGRITASFGVAHFRHGESAVDFIERADRCLYSAKNSGRNRVVAEGNNVMHNTPLMPGVTRDHEAA